MQMTTYFVYDREVREFKVFSESLLNLLNLLNLPNLLKTNHNHLLIR